MKNQFWRKALLGVLLTTSVAAPIALAERADTGELQSEASAQTIDYRGGDRMDWRGDRYGHHDERIRYGHGDRERFMPPGMGMSRGPGSPALGILRFQQELQLSDDQVQRLENAAEQSQRELISLRSQLEILQLDQRELVRQDELDLAAMRQKNQELADLQLKMANLRVTELSTVQQVLSPEQWQQWKKQGPSNLGRGMERRDRWDENDEDQDRREERGRWN